MSYVCKRCHSLNMSIGSDPAHDACLDCGFQGNEDVGRLRRLRERYADIDTRTLEWLFEQLTGDPSPADTTPIDVSHLRHIEQEHTQFKVGAFLRRVLD